MVYNMRKKKTRKIPQARKIDIKSYKTKTRPRAYLEDLKEVSDQYGIHLANQSSEIDTRETEKHVMDRLRREETPWWAKVKDTFRSKKILVSATATACVALLLVTILRISVPDSPSAIVTSASLSTSPPKKVA